MLSLLMRDKMQWELWTKLELETSVDKLWNYVLGLQVTMEAAARKNRNEAK